MRHFNCNILFNSHHNYVSYIVLLEQYSKHRNKGAEPSGDLARSQLSPRPSDTEAHVLNVNAIMHIGYRSLYKLCTYLLYVMNVLQVVMICVNLTEPQGA